jgi:FG-GAP-like repeat
VQGPKGVFTDVSKTALPAGTVALGDAEFGDVDGDGDLDLVLADWGPPPIDAGGPTRLWLNDGHGVFTDATDRMPAVKIGMSWDLEVIDLDDDGDLDVIVSCKLCSGGKAFVNDGTGHFSDDSLARLPQHANNYEYEPMDIDGDGDLDLVTINDGPDDTETVLINDGAGHFTDDTAARIAAADNLAGADDNCDTFLDVDGDGDADFVIGSLSAADRLMRNDGHGHFTMVDTVMTLATPGTLGLAVADLDHDGRLDVVQAQGEAATPEKVLLANHGVAVDTAPPDVRIVRPAGAEALEVIARAHDHQSPSRDSDWRRVALEIVEPQGTAPIAMRWHGEYEWAATLPAPPAGGTLRYRVCATDAAGNAACSAEKSVGSEMGSHDGAPTTADAGSTADAGPDNGGHHDAGCCDAGDRAPATSSIIILAIAIARRRRIRTS